MSGPSPAPPVAIRLPDGWQPLVDPGWLEGWTPQRFELHGGTTDVVVMGEGPPLLLLPPLPGYKEAFLGVARALAACHRVVTFDLRMRFAGPPSWEALLADLKQVADAFAPGPALVVGHSFGGALALRWALARPARVRGLVLSSSFARVAAGPRVWPKRFLEQPLVLASQRLLPAGAARRVARALAARRAWVYDPGCDDRVLDFVRFGIRRVSPAAAAACVRLAFAHDLRATAGGWRGPTLLLAGSGETAWARAAVDELGRLLPQAARQDVAGAGHLHPLSAPGAFVAAVTEWAAARGLGRPPPIW